MFYQLSKDLEFHQNTPLNVVFSTLFSVFGYPDKILFLVFDILLHLFIFRFCTFPSLLGGVPVFWEIGGRNESI